MKGRPKVAIGIIILNEEGNKLLLGFNNRENCWQLPGGDLKYSEDFTECALRELSNKLNLAIEQERLNNFISFNVVDRVRNFHCIEIDFLLQITMIEQQNIRNSAKVDYDWWVWFEYKEILEVKAELAAATEVLFKKFSISSIDNIKNLFGKLV